MKESSSAIFPDLQVPSPLHSIELPWTKGFNLFLKRDDLIHPVISGNKWRKLSGYYEKILHGNYEGIITFGGAYSNHVHAVGYFCYCLGISCSIYLRGNYETPTIHDLQRWKIETISFSIEDYNRQKEIQDIENRLVIPEGGEGETGERGCKKIIDEIDMPYDILALPVGTGTTLKGIVKHTTAELWGFSAIKNPDIIRKELGNMVTITDEFVGKGYGKVYPELIQFILEFFEQTGILLDPVYTGKMLYGIKNLAEKNLFNGKTLIAIHTGGLQGCRGIPELHKLYDRYADVTDQTD